MQYSRARLRHMHMRGQSNRGCHSHHVAAADERNHIAQLKPHDYAGVCVSCTLAALQGLRVGHLPLIHKLQLHVKGSHLWASCGLLQ
jgi:hypothetical protein